MRKRLLCGVLVGCMAFAMLTGCASKDSGTQSTTEPTAPTSQAETTPTPETGAIESTEPTTKPADEVTTPPASTEPPSSEPRDRKSVV